MRRESFDNEKELEGWVKAHLAEFLPTDFVLNGFQVTTPSGKRGVPDLFAFDLKGRRWFVIECELLSHGVWNHIAEQVVRFAVASQHEPTRRVIRDRLFEEIMASDKQGEAAGSLQCPPERVFQQLEQIMVGTTPEVVIFIDESDRDLEDMARALNVPTTVFRIQKFRIDGTAHYWSPDASKPVISEENETAGVTSLSEDEILESLGGGTVTAASGRFRCYRLPDGQVVHFKRSKHHERQGYFWYGISTDALEKIRDASVNDIIFVMDDFGYARVPLSVVEEFMIETGVSRNPDGSVRHFHLLISDSPEEPELFFSQDRKRFSLKSMFVPLD